MIDTAEPRPFVNAALLPRYASKTVRLVGKTSSGGGAASSGADTVLLSASDGQTVTVKTCGPTSPFLNNTATQFVEVEGVVEADGGACCLREVKTTNFGDKFGT